MKNYFLKNRFQNYWRNIDKNILICFFALFFLGSFFSFSSTSSLAGERLDNIASVAIPAFDNKNLFKATVSVSGWKQFFTNKTVPKYYKTLSSFSNQLRSLLSNE